MAGTEEICVRSFGWLATVGTEMEDLAWSYGGMNGDLWLSLVFEPGPVL